MAFELSLLIPPQLTKEDGEGDFPDHCFLSPTALSFEVKNENGRKTWHICKQRF